jgi:hypothetical protein
MLGLGLAKLGAFDDRAWGVDVAALRGRVAGDVAALDANGEAASRLVANPPRIELATRG